METLCLAHASILCTVMGADQNKESYPGVGSTCLCYCSPQKSAYIFRVNEIRLMAGERYDCVGGIVGMTELPFNLYIVNLIPQLYALKVELNLLLF